HVDLERGQALAERGLEVLPAVTAMAERREIRSQRRESPPRDQIVGDEKRELVDRQRAFLQVPGGEALRSALRRELGRAAEQACGGTANAGRRGLPAVLQGIEPEVLERRERDPLRHAFGEPLLASPFAARELDLRDMGELVRDQSQPLALRAIRWTIVQEHLT